MNGIDVFATHVLEIYNADQEAFWDAAMAPFLAGGQAMVMLKHPKIGMGLLTAFRTVEAASMDLLKRRFEPVGIDITQWSSLRAKLEYFHDAWPIYAFLAIWMQEQSVEQPLARFPEILQAVSYGIAGYGILDVQVDGTHQTPLELLVAQSLIADYENRILQPFGVNATSTGILHRIRNHYLQAEIREKSLRHIRSPYNPDDPGECGAKAAHLLTPFMLSLETIGKSDLIDPYFDVFMKFGAVIQIIDDLKDLEDDLAIGHFSFVTLNTDAVEKVRRGATVPDIARNLLADRTNLMALYRICKQLIRESGDILARLDDHLLERIVMVTDLRLDSYFRKDLKMPV